MWIRFERSRDPWPAGYVVYLIQRIDLTSPSRQWKVGVSKNVKKRIKGIDGHIWSLVSYRSFSNQEDAYKYEAELHERMKWPRSHGREFYICPRVI